MAEEFAPLRREGNRGTESLDVIPAVIVGLGGTGGEILLRIRRKFFEASRSFSLREWPIIEYLYIDTDLNDRDIDHYHSQFFRLSRNEFFPATLDDWTIYTRNLQNHPSLRKWWYEDQQALKSTALNAGAGQIRGYSRLGMWRHAQDITERIRTLCSQVTSPNATNYMASRGIPVDTSKLWVYVIGSLAGGTGSGAFIDMGYILRQLNVTGLEAMGFFVLPSAFDYLAIPKSRLRANAYAALMELEYYTSLQMRHGSFDDTWSNNLPKSPQLDPPYVRTFLIDGANIANQNVGGAQAREGLFELVAESIYLDYAHSGFGSKKRSVYPNQDQYLNGIYKYVHLDPTDKDKVLLSEPFCQSYQTFGLSKIYLPIDRIKKSASFEMWARAFRALAGSLTPDDIRPIREQVLSTERIHMFRGLRRVKGRAVDADDFRDALMQGEGVGATLAAFVTQGIENIRRKAIEGAEKERPRFEYVGGEVDAFEHDCFVQPSQDAASFREWGTVYRLMEINRQRFAKQVRDELGRVAREFADDPHRGIGFAIELMEDLKRYLVGQADGQEKLWKGEQDTARARLNGLRAGYNTALLNLREHEAWNWFSAPLLKGTTIRHDVNRACRSAEAWFLETLRLRYLTTCIDLARELAKEIDERIGELKRTAETVTKLAESFSTRAGQFSKVTVSPMDECPYDPADVVGYYMPRVLVKDAEGGAADDLESRLNRGCLDQAAGVLATLQFEVGEETRSGLSIYDIPTVCDRLGAETFELLLGTAGMPVFAPLDDVNVIRVFRQKHTDAGIRQAKITSVILRALPWFARNPKFTEMKAQDLTAMYCYNREPGADFDEFERMVKNSIPASLPNLSMESTTQKHAVVFFTQMAGIPLCYGSSLVELHHAYQESVRSGTDRLHISKQEWRYPSIVHLSNDELMRLREATEIFLVGLAMGCVKVLEQKLSGGGVRHVYFYTYNELGIPRDRQLGIESAAIQKLIDDGEARADIRDQVEDVLEGLEKRGETGSARAVLLSYFSQGGKYAPVNGTDGRGTAFDRVPMESVVLKDYYRKRFGSGDSADAPELLKNLDLVTVLLPDGHRTVRLEQRSESGGGGDQ